MRLRRPRLTARRLPSLRVLGPTRHQDGPGPGLAYSAICHKCGVTHISVIRDFPTPYVCEACSPTTTKEWKEAWLAKHPRCARGHLQTDETVYWNRAIRQAECRLCKKINTQAAKQRQAEER